MSWKDRYATLAREHGLALAQLIFVERDFNGLSPGDADLRPILVMHDVR